jgi:hypothetical protein
MPEKTLNMTITLNVEGEEGLTVTIEYRNTTLETVKLVENTIMKALAEINQ